MFILERVTNPEIEPVSLAEMKRQVKAYMSDTSRDEDFESLIVTAREWLEGYTGRALIDQSWRLTVDPRGMFANDIVQSASTGRLVWNSSSNLSKDGIRLRKSPVLAITSFVSVGDDGSETEIDVATYELREARSKWPRVFPLDGSTWSQGTFRITFRAGFADRTGSPVQGAEVVPAIYKQAMKLWAEANFERDPTMMPLLMNTAAAIVKAERVELDLA